MTSILKISALAIAAAVTFPQAATAADKNIVEVATSAGSFKTSSLL
jgi:hypothetical protein